MCSSDEHIKPTSAIHRYNPTSNSWDLISNMPTARFWSLVAVLPTSQMMGKLTHRHYGSTDVFEVAKLSF